MGARTTKLRASATAVAGVNWKAALAGWSAGTVEAPASGRWGAAVEAAVGAGAAGLGRAAAAATSSIIQMA